MLTRPSRRRLLLSTVFALAACGQSSNGPTGTNVNTTGVTATVNGTAWSGNSALAVAVHVLPGLYSISSSGTGGANYTMILQLFNIGFIHRRTTGRNEGFAHRHQWRD